MYAHARELQDSHADGLGPALLLSAVRGRQAVQRLPEDGPELRGYDKKEPLIRIDDHVAVMDPATRRFLQDQGFRMISFRPLRDLQRSAP